MSSAQDYLLQALKQAQSRRGFCAPNPAVGAVIVKNGQIIAEGAHQRAGLPHAEIEALKQAGAAARGATLYVSLEPCNHQGKTPPCTQAIIERGITEVYFAYKDPNSGVKGGGAEALMQQGIQSHHLPLPEIDEFYLSYVHWLKHKRPFVTAKLALSLDGKIAYADHSPASITGKEAQSYTHQWRKQSDALLTTAKTIMHDDPQFNIRLGEEVITKPLYVIDRLAQLPLNAKIFHTTSSLTIFHSAEADLQRIQQLQQKGARCVPIKTRTHGLDEMQLLRYLGAEGIHDLWIEAGGKCFESFYEAKLLNRVLFYISPKSLGIEARAAFQQAHNFIEKAQKFNSFSLGQDNVFEILY